MKRSQIRGRSGFDRQTRTRINRLRRSGQTWSQISSEFGMSTSSMYDIRKGNRRMGTILQQRYVERSNFDLTGPAPTDTLQWEDDKVGRISSAGIQTLLRVNSPDNPLRGPDADRTYREAQKLADQLGPNFEGTVERPTITKKVIVNGKEVEVSWKLGRGKSDEQRKRIEDQLRSQGIKSSEFDTFYDEATGYTGVRY